MSYPPQGIDKSDILTDLSTVKANQATLLNRLTAPRAGYLDELAAANLPADLDTLLARITAVRAAYIDALPAIELDAEHTEQHLHSRNRLFAKSGDQSGTNWGEVDGLTPYRCISGDSDFGEDEGDTAKVIGSTDTPVIAGRIHFDPGRVTVIATSSTSLWAIRLVWGTGTVEEAEATGQYSDHWFQKESNAGWSSVVDVRTPLLDIGTKVWARAKNETDNATIDFVISEHEYPL